MSGSPQSLSGPWGRASFAEDGRPRLRERVFRAPLLTQLREGAWPYTLEVLLPGLVLALVLSAKYATGAERAEWALVIGLLIAGAIARLFSSLNKAMKPETRATSTCAWISLGDGYIRLGMSFLRSKILFQQIVDVERGILERGQWVSETDATDRLSGVGEGPRPPRPSAPGRPRIRVRVVMRRTWEVRAFAYPVSIDPSGELTTHLAAAGSRTRDRLRIPSGAPDDAVTAAFRRLATLFAHRAGAAASAAKATEYALSGPAQGGRYWVLPPPDPLPESELPPAMPSSAPASSGTAPARREEGPPPPAV